MVARRSVQPPPTQSHYITGCANEEGKRLAVLEELVATEHSYLKDLHVLIHHYLTPLKQSLILDSNDVLILATNIEQIQALHTEIFNHLLLLIEDHKTNSDHPLSHFFVHYFLKISDQLKIYSTYASEIPERIAKDPLFVMYLDRVRSVSGSKLHLDSFLIKPIQRICKYPLLFRELERSTAEADADRPKVQELVRTLEAVVQFVNDSRKQFEAVKRVIEVEQMLSDLPEPLASSGRVLVKEGMLQKQSPREGSFRQDRYCFLFRGPIRRDLLVYTKMKNKKSYVFRGQLELSSCYMKELPSPQTGFVLLLPNNTKTYTFFCKSMEEKQAWITELASMVRPSKPADGFVKMGSFYPSRPPSQTSTNRLSNGGAAATSTNAAVNIGSVFRRQHASSPSPSSLTDATDSMDGAGSDSGYSSPPTFSPIQSRWNLQTSNDSDKSLETDDLYSSSPSLRDADYMHEFGTPPPTSIPSRSVTTVRKEIARTSLNLVSNPQHVAPTIETANELTEDQREIHRLQSIITDLQYRLHAEATARIRAERELEIVKQRLFVYEPTAQRPQPSSLEHHKYHHSPPHTKNDYKKQTHANEHNSPTKPSPRGLRNESSTSDFSNSDFVKSPTETHISSALPADASNEAARRSSTPIHLLAELFPKKPPDVHKEESSSQLSPYTSQDSDQSPTSSSIIPSIFRPSESSTPAIPDFGTNYEWIKEGTLIKMGEVRQNWKSRWFRLAPGLLLYFKTFRDDPKKYLGVVHLTKDVTVTRSTRKMFCVAIHTATREWFLCAVTEKEAAEWMQALVSAVGAVPKLHEHVDII